MIQTCRSDMPNLNDLRRSDHDSVPRIELKRNPAIPEATRQATYKFIEEFRRKTDERFRVTKQPEQPKNEERKELDISEIREYLKNG